MAVVLVGLDGTDDVLVRELLDAGELPALAALLARGRWGGLRAPRGFSDTASWASFSTCWTPDRHGWVNVRRVDPESYEVVRIHRWHADGVPFWQHVSDAGRTVTILDVPKSPVGRDLRGVEIADWLVHTPDLPDRILADPPAFADEVVAAHGPGHGGTCLPSSGVDLDAYAAERRTLGRRATDLTLAQLAAREADLVVTVLGAGHCLGHNAWQRRDLVVDLYRALDGHVAEIVEAVGPEATVVVFSPRGMTEDAAGRDLTDEVCRRLDAAAPADVERHHRLVAAWRRLVPLRVRQAMPTRWHRTATARSGQARANRSFFATDSGSLSGGIRVNVIGRETAGVVDPTDFEATLARLTTAFEALADADTGEPVVDTVERVDGRWSGPHADLLPDLFVHWAPRTGDAIASPEVGRIERGPAGRRTGHHTDAGWFVAAGPGIAPGADLSGVAIEDLGPTVCALLGVALPDVDGRPIAGLLAP